MNLLEVRDLRASYGDFAALQGVSVDVAEGDIVAIVGSNGAGKSTLLKTIAGILPAGAGSISFRGRSIERLSARERVAMGLALTLEGRRLFPEMSVEDNLLVGAEIGRVRPRVKRNLAAMCERFPVLAERRNQLAGTLSGGEQQMLAIARALMSEPSLLMLDEPSLGLAPRITAQIFELVREINRSGVTVVLVEQNVASTLALAGSAYVLSEGRVAFSGPAQEIARREDVKAAYLGETLAGGVNL